MTGQLTAFVLSLAMLCLSVSIGGAAETPPISNRTPGGVESQRPAAPARITIKAEDTVLYAVLYDNRTAREFAELLPLTLNAFDRIGLVKSTVLPRPISDEGERTRKYARGAVFYWPEGPEVAFCYSDHLPETVVDIIHIGMIESGVEFFQDYAGEILIELTDGASM
ncbi:MAG: hypothetical protein LBQ90_05875 [Synergistaceae bacterium]|jgi:hypothetical protein|nr:hypothetical protein [Synergistaceae bacterium]